MLIQMKTKTPKTHTETKKKKGKNMDYTKKLSTKILIIEIGT